MRQFGFEAPPSTTDRPLGWRAADGRSMPLAAPSSENSGFPAARLRAAARCRTRSPEHRSWEAALARARLRANSEPDRQTAATRLEKFSPRSSSASAEEGHWNTALAIARARVG